MTEAGKLYSIALDVRGKRCVVVGGGAVGTRKSAALAEAGAIPVVIAPHVSLELVPLIENATVQHCPETFKPEHLEGAFLVIAATDVPSVNQEVADAAHARGVLLNLAAPTHDEALQGDFATMATVRRGDLLVALTTGGAGPALSARLRREMEAQFGQEWAAYTTLLGEMRSMAKQRITGEPERTIALRRLAASDAILPRLASGDEVGAREEALSCLFP